MLTPDELLHATDELEEAFYQTEVELLKDIARRIKGNNFNMTSSAEYQIVRAKEIGIQYDEARKILLNELNYTSEDIEQIISNAVWTSIDRDIDIYKAAYQAGQLNHLEYDKKSIMILLARGTKEANQELQNICNTTALASNKRFIELLDQTYLMIQSGAFSADSAMDIIISDLAKSGLRKVTYKSGAKRSVDTAVRTAVRTSINQTACKGQMLLFNELGGNLVAVSSHMGARPSHAEWQGKVYYVKTPYKDYKNFYEATGYGTGDGLGGWNCRHSFFPYFEGVSTNPFEHYGISENQVYYEAEQEQRYNERMIREWKKRRDIKAAGGIDNSREARKVREWTNRQKSFLAEHPELKRQYAREKGYFSSVVFSENLLSDFRKMQKTDELPVAFKFSKEKEENLMKVYAEIDGRFMKDGNEHLGMCYADNGKLIGISTSNEKNHVVPSEDMIELIINSKPNSFTLIHNHPKGTPISIGDIITTLRNPSIKESIVINNSGEIYFFSVGNGVRIDLSTNTQIEGLVKEYRNLVVFYDGDRERAIKALCEKGEWNYGKDKK